MDPLAEVQLRQGRLWLVVAGIFIAMQGDPMHDETIDDEERYARWSEAGLRQTAERINARLAQR